MEKLEEKMIEILHEMLVLDMASGGMNKNHKARLAAKIGTRFEVFIDEANDKSSFGCKYEDTIDQMETWILKHRQEVGV